MKIIFNTNFQYTPLGEGGKNKLFVIKIGGNVIDDVNALSSFLKSFSDIFGASSSHPFKGRGLLVHGGGKIATAIGDKLGVQSKYINGRRITDDDTIDIVTMVYGGLINKKIVAQLQSLQCNAIGLCGADANLIPANKRSPLVDGGIKVPQIGWNNIYDLKTDLFKGLAENSYCYFVHGYYAALGEHTIATTDYVQPYSSALHKNNFYGVQFHPESILSEYGETIIHNWVNKKD